MFEVLPEWLVSSDMGWAAFVVSWVGFISLVIFGRLVPRTTAMMWKEAYETERAARIEKGDATDEEHRATVATMVHLLESLQGGEQESDNS